MHCRVTYSHASCVKKATQNTILKDAAGALQVTNTLGFSGIEHTQHIAGFTSTGYLIQTVKFIKSLHARSGHEKIAYVAETLRLSNE